jgi:hypothetical protein
MNDAAGPEEWARRFEHQAVGCESLGSTLYGRLLRLLAVDCARTGTTWDLVSGHASLRFGQAGPLRLLGAAHRLALAGEDPGWASVLPSCGGSPPDDDEGLWEQWSALVDRAAAHLVAGLDREVQTNEVARAAGLGLALAMTGFDAVRLVELGCSGGLNLRLDRFRIELGGHGRDGVVLGDPRSDVQLAPEVTGPVDHSIRLPTVVERIGLDPHPVDATSEGGALTLLGFLWPDQDERIARARAAIDTAGRHPAELRRVADTAAAIGDLLVDPTDEGVGTVVQHSIVWQYIPTDMRWAVTGRIEAAGERASATRPLAWVRYEPDEWNRLRAAVWLRTWPGGADRLVAHADFHGRWLSTVPDLSGSERS